MAPAVICWFSLLRPGFYLRLFHMSFMVDVVDLVLVFVCIFLFSPVSNVSLMLCTHIHIYIALTRRTSRQSLGKLQTKQCCLGCQGALDRNVLPHCQSSTG
jgi:hypothetical protein